MGKMVKNPFNLMEKAGGGTAKDKSVHSKHMYRHLFASPTIFTILDNLEVTANDFYKKHMKKKLHCHKGFRLDEPNRILGSCKKALEWISGIGEKQIPID